MTNREKIKNLLLEKQVNELLWLPVDYLDKDIELYVKAESDNIKTLQAIINREPIASTATKEQKESFRLEEVYPWIKKWENDALYSLSNEWFKYLVNITTERKKKKATIIEIQIAHSLWMELDPERWDKVFVEYKEAQEYADTFNL